MNWGGEGGTRAEWLGRLNSPLSVFHNSNPVSSEWRKGFIV